MLRKLTIIIINLGICSAIGQEVLIESKFPVRTFDFLNDSICYSNEHFINCSIGDSVFETFYAGGTCIDLDVIGENVITLANNYMIEKGTVRIYDLKANKYSLVYNIDGPTPMMAFSFMPSNEDSKAIIISFTDGNLNWYDSKGTLLKTFGNYNIIRKIKLDNNQIYFCSDNGDLYVINGEKTSLLFSVKSNSRILGFELSDNYIYAYNDIGNLICYNRNSKELKEFPISDSIITDIIIASPQLIIISDWNGKLIYFDTSSSKKTHEFQGHKKRILKLKMLDNDFFISSGHDGLLKKWKLNFL